MFSLRENRFVGNERDYMGEYSDSELYSTHSVQLMHSQFGDVRLLGVDERIHTWGYQFSEGVSFIVFPKMRYRVARVEVRGEGKYADKVVDLTEFKVPPREEMENPASCINKQYMFTMPPFNVCIYVSYQRIPKELEVRENMELKKINGVVDTFEIPEDLAKELSELLTKQVIREKVLVQLVDDPAKYEEAEKLLIPVVSKIEAIKVKITREFVPEKYNSNGYVWNYDGYEIDENRVMIMKA